MSTYDAIQKINPEYKINRITDNTFSRYGVLYPEYDLTDLTAIMNQIPIPNEDSYTLSDDRIESVPVLQQISADLFAGLPTQAGICTGHNTYFSAAEFHQGSEINIFFTDVIIVVGKRANMHHFQFNAANDGTLYFVPAGCVVELYSDTLHYTPISIHPEGYKMIAQSLKTTSLALPRNYQTENPLVTKLNKFQITHESRVDKVKQGVYPGLIGDLIAISPLIN